MQLVTIHCAQSSSTSVAVFESREAAEEFFGVKFERDKFGLLYAQWFRPGERSSEPEYLDMKPIKFGQEIKVTQ